MKYKHMLTALIASVGLVTHSAQALISVGNVSFNDTTIEYPTESSFSVNYRMFNSQIYNPGASYVDFYLTQDDGETGVSIGRSSAGVRCSTSSGITTCRGAIGQQTHTANNYTMPYETRTALANLCSPVSFKVIGLYNGSRALSSNSAMIGTQKLPDWLLTSGSISPNTVAAGDSVVIQATVATTCPQTVGAAPTLGVYLTDANGQGLIYYGETNIVLPYGSTHTITVSIPQNLAAGNYMIALVSDHRQTVNESNENNNVATAALTVVSGSATQEEIAAAQDEQSLLPSSSGYVTYIDRSPLSSDNFIGSGMSVTEGMKVLDTNTKTVEGLVELHTPAVIPLKEKE